jgi:Eukaryotic aspartyl protease
MYSGTYDFGFIDSLKYTGTITYITIDSSSGNWGFTGSGYAVGSSSFVSYSIDAGYIYIYSSHSPFLHNISPVLTPEHRFCSFRTLSLRRTTIKSLNPLSTSLSGLFLRRDDLAIMYGLSDTYGGYVFPCSTTLPNLTLGIDRYLAVVPSEYINYGQISSSKCFGGVQSSSGTGSSLYGDVFLKSQFVAFDGSDTPRLGFAQCRRVDI